MSSSQGLYNKMYETLRRYHPQERVNRIEVWVWVIVGLIQGQSVHLSRIATFIPSLAQAAGRIAQARRWLANRHLEVQTLYDPIIRDVLRAWRGRRVDLIVDSKVWFADGRSFTVAALTPQAINQPHYLPDIRLTSEHRWRCNLALVRTRDGKVCALMTNPPLSRWVLRHYLKRMHIEQAFRDDKSGSFDLAASRLRDPKRLHALLLAVAIATLWLLELRQPVLRTGQRQQLDPAHQRQLSLFQLGWRFLQRALACFEPPPLTFNLRPFRLNPVQPSNC